MTEILAMATVIAPVTAGAVEVVKQATNINNRYLPAVATVVGIGLGAAAYFLDADLGLRIWAGAISGLSAVGLFELGKQTNKE